jgi:hypothetical protein
MVERCLAKEPGDRPTASELLEQLSGTALPAGCEAAACADAPSEAATAGEEADCGDSRSRTASASASHGKSSSARATPSMRVTTVGPRPQTGSGNAPAVPNVPVPAVLASLSAAHTQDGDVFVYYQDSADASAQVSGQVTNAASGEVAKLYAQQFPFASAAAPVASATLSGATAQYSFTVTPSLVTRYTVKVFRSSSAAWRDAYRHCTLSSEAEDGIGLPGSGANGCGGVTLPQDAGCIG